MTKQVLKGFVQLNETILDVGTGGFLKVSKYNEEEEEKKRAAQVMRPVMTAED